MKRNQKFEPNGDARLMHQVKEVLRYCRYAVEQLVCYQPYVWVKDSIGFYLVFPPLFCKH
ncbi:hypothetical protein IH879_17630 [candidate division KSB1 bacterium]|nr:hypothetical protein [candidate division KSB1 bacterium]